MVRARKISSKELVTFFVDRTKKLELSLNSYITFLGDQAIAQAEAADAEIGQGKYRGPLHGIPISIKDHFDTAGVTTTAGAKYRKDNIPTTDSGVAARLKRAGAILMGKANMNKFAGGESGDNPDFGKIRNPWNTGFSPGGSSGGSGAHVAAGLAPLSIGSDNGGSIRIPAALCGIVGLKPTYGRISMDGMFPRAYSFDHPGPLTRNVTDCALALQILAGHDRGETTSARKPVPDYVTPLKRSIRGMRIGVDKNFASVGQPVVLDRFQKALDQLVSLGCTIHEVASEQLDYKPMEPVLAELYVALDDLYRKDPNRPKNMQIDPPVTFSAFDYIRAMQKRREHQIGYARATKDVDVFACPSYPLEKRAFDGYPKVNGKEFTFDDAVHYTIPFDLLGVPAISIPCGFSDDGFPVGLQLVGRAFDEVTVLTAAYAYEQATAWHTMHPQISS
jgi:aspartyl-tRNA(Asn)/glutamyl-tRNA(Gln) amidotransferase subunit A